MSGADRYGEAAAIPCSMLSSNDLVVTMPLSPSSESA